MASTIRRTQQNACDGTSETTNYDGNNTEPLNDRPGTSEKTNDNLETKAKINQPVGSESAIKKPGPSAQNVEHYLDAVNFQRSKFVFSPLVDEIHAEDKVDEIEDIDPNSETSVAGTSKSYIGKRVRPNADNIVVVLAKRLKERDTNFLSQQEKRHNDVDFFFKRVAEIIKTFPEINIRPTLIPYNPAPLQPVLTPYNFDTEI
ncbi:unnamed protein product [Macrosiphum euphorbiae]|uniref:Uncharacterized protein n=1 Tax=Macrosiphum euphorbiae TaxID=13131 RepID=A0AAV0XCF9_9HEMI|nr:unnamed protein product [Macrosiphum euphorbiae]